MSDQRMTAEVASAEFDRFADVWDLDTDTASMEDEDRQSFEQQKRRLVRHIQSGKLAVEENGELLLQLSGGFENLSELRFKIPKGDAVLAWDRYKDRQQVHKLNAFMGSMTGQAPAIFGKMDGRDLKVCQAVATLFLGS